ncbi:unnamed protein product [Staurois parvus]|uniref:Uncharacterized protein n=1 Tax=Staurois parvus TaxID=386267 RepID=A0ABN9D8P1_9NEOB|nr:unnamed protein product [Staurois parvus]
MIPPTDTNDEALLLPLTLIKEQPLLSPIDTNDGALFLLPLTLMTIELPN